VRSYEVVYGSPRLFHGRMLVLVNYRELIIGLSRSLFLSLARSLALLPRRDSDEFVLSPKLARGKKKYRASRLSLNPCESRDELAAERARERERERERERRI